MLLWPPDTNLLLVCAGPACSLCLLQLCFMSAQTCAFIVLLLSTKLRPLICASGCENSKLPEIGLCH